MLRLSTSSCFDPIVRSPRLLSRRGSIIIILRARISRRTLVSSRTPVCYKRPQADGPDGYNKLRPPPYLLLDKIKENPGYYDPSTNGPVDNIETTTPQELQTIKAKWVDSSQLSWTVLHKCPCAACLTPKTRDEYSAAQWNGSKGVQRRCLECVATHQTPKPAQRRATVRKASTQGYFTQPQLDNCIVGGYYKVAVGMYSNEDFLSGGPCVAKWLHSGHIQLPYYNKAPDRDADADADNTNSGAASKLMTTTSDTESSDTKTDDSSSADADIESGRSAAVVDLFVGQAYERFHAAQELIGKFNTEFVIEEDVQLQIPELFVFHHKDVRGPDWSNALVFQEAFLKQYQKFNSNTGWVDEDRLVQQLDSWHQAMQALSHFTYHITDGQQMLCDLAGRADSTGAILSDPAVLSAESTSKKKPLLFGPSDLGPEGMQAFFRTHECNTFCSGHWKRPKFIPASAASSYKVQKGTFRRLQ